MCVCERARARALKMVSMDKIFRFTNTLIIIMKTRAVSAVQLCLSFFFFFFFFFEAVT